MGCDILWRRWRVLLHPKQKGKSMKARKTDITQLRTASADFSQTERRNIIGFKAA